MRFNIKELKSLLISIKHNQLNYIKVKEPTFELIVSKEIIKTSIQNPQLFKTVHDINNIKQTPKLTLNKSSKIEITKNKQDAEAYFTIVSPMVGTFYRAPAPNEPYFIELQDTVKIHQTVCIVEAMKLMNEIEAEVSGEVVEILVEDGAIIDSGQALMKIRPIS